MTPDQLLVLAGGIAALAWVNVYFFVLPRRKAAGAAEGQPQAEATQGEAAQETGEGARTAP